MIGWGHTPMGLFDFLFRRGPDDGSSDIGSDGRNDGSSGPSSPAQSTPSSSGWRARIAAASRADDFDWDWGNALAHRIVHAILEEIAPRFGTPERPAKIKEVPDDENIDLRGTFRGVPVRFAVWMSFGSFWAIEMRAPMWAGHFDIERDYEKIPKHGDADDPWDEDDGRRIFLAKGIFVEGDEAEVSRKLDLWSQLPEATRRAIVAGMEQLDAQHLSYAGESVRLAQGPGLPDLDDPGAYLEGCAALLAELKDGVEEAGLLSAGATQVADTTLPAPIRVGCHYCGTLFVSGLAHQNCPNCGAPPRA